MVKADWHIFQVLTKREERMLDLARSLPWPRTVWIGVTIERTLCLSRGLPASGAGEGPLRLRGAVAGPT
jgi:protein gp37